MKTFLLGCLVGVMTIGLHAQTPAIHLIPQPQQVKPGQGTFTLAPATQLVVKQEALQPSINALNQHLQQFYGFSLTTTRTASGKAPAIELQTGTSTQKTPGSYELYVSPQKITITGIDAQGVFYGVQSLLQLMPLPTTKALLVKVPAVHISDAPRFDYRGMMLDVARHFQPVEEVKKMIDRLAMLKMNTFHWHLTEDQGWRIEIKKYPKLTEVGAWRDGTIIGRYPGTGNDNQRYGGYYTQEQIKEVVQYAAERYITVVPEIEMPGHSAAAIASYPFLSCFPEEETIIPKHPSEAARQKKGKKVMESWGVYEDVFAPTEATFQFLQDVIDEIVPLFPGKYIHIGGDECPKEAWKRSAFCQQLIKEKGLKDEHGLQSYFIQRMEKYINSKGKQIIGWDEILEGGLAPNATVMSWRGEEGGIEAAKQKHDVIMTPTTYCYLDYSQTANEDSVTIGGFIPLEKIYAYDPMPAELKGTPFAAYVRGTQANVWTEYMRSASKVEYMIFPRLAAFSEVAWTQPQHKNWERFESKIPSLFQRLDKMGTNYSKAYYALRGQLSATPEGGMLWTLSTKNPDAAIYYSGPDGIMQAYSKPVAIDKSGDWAASMRQDNRLLQTLVQPISLHKATGKKITTTTPPSPKYPGNGGLQALVNGATSNKGLNSTEWCGWDGQDAELIIDLGKATAMQQVVVNSIESAGSWIYRPSAVVVHTSADGKQWQQAGMVNLKELEPTEQFRKVYVSLQTASARYVKVQVKNFGIIPKGMPGASNPAWLFIDEIEVN